MFADSIEASSGSTSTIVISQVISLYELFVVDASYILTYNYIIGIFLGFSILQVSQAILPMILTVRKYFKERQTTTPQGNEQSQEVIFRKV